SITSLLLLCFRETSSPGRDELELWVAHRPHLGQIESFEFRFCTHALTDEKFHEEIKSIGDRENYPHERRATDELSHKLSRVAVEGSGDRSTHAVPTATVVARSVSKEADRNHSPQATRAVHRGCTNRIVNFHDAFNELDAEADQESRDKPDNDSTNWVDKAA